MKSDEIRKLIDSFNTKYYEEELEKIEQRIENVRAGFPEFKGIYNSYNDEKTLTKEEKEKRIRSLENRKKDIKKHISELNSVIANLEINISKIEEIAKKQALLSKLEQCIWDRRFSDNKELSLNDVYKKLDKKLYCKSKGKLYDATSKINKEVYKMLKNNKNLQVTQFGSIESTIDNSDYRMDTLFNKAEHLFEFEYGNKLSTLGVDIERLNNAIKAMQKKPTQYTITFNGKLSLERLNHINLYLDKNYDLKEGYSNLKILQEKYNEFVLLSREVWYMNEVILSFSKTSIVDTEMYKGLKELYYQQKEKLHELRENADKLYDKSGIQRKIDAEQRLRELYQLMQEKEFNINRYKELGYYDQVSYAQNDLYEIRLEMIRILRDNPELNRVEYNIDIKGILEKEKEIYKPEVEKVNKIKEEDVINIQYKVEEEIKQSKEIEESEKTNESSRDEEDIPVHIETKEEEIFIDKAYQEESENKKIFELNNNLQIHRFTKYQDYMREKVIGSELGKLSFSQYLEKEAPYLTELIKIEKEREKQARNIYREYIRYYASLEEKEYALSFEQFANKNYGIENIDVPVEYEEEYKEMRRK